MRSSLPILCDKSPVPIVEISMVGVHPLNFEGKQREALSTEHLALLAFVGAA